MQDFQVMIGANRPPLRLRQSRHNTLSQRPYSLTSNDRREDTCTMQCGSRPNNYALLPRVTEKTKVGTKRTLGELPAPNVWRRRHRAYQCVLVAGCAKALRL